jgi:hypothetical protein
MEINLNLDWNCGGYNESIFALRMGKFLVMENVSITAIFESLESCYEPEFSDYEIEVWNNGKWESVIN